MSLTAITAKMALFNPSVLIDMGTPRESVVNSMRQLQRDGLYCPHCYRELRELIPVQFRNSEDRRPHFFHIKDVGSATECKNGKGESEKHNAAKVAIAESLKIHGLIDMSLDQRFLTSPEVTKRKPDIWVTYPNGATEAHEIQISAITSDVLAQRTRDLKQHGVASVHWYLYRAAYTRENRQWCHTNHTPVYRLWFDGHDSSPRWNLDALPDKTTVHVRQPVDSCAFDQKVGPSNESAVEQDCVPPDLLRQLQGKRIVRHLSLGYVGYVYAYPWQIESCVDVLWVSPVRDTPGRMPISLVEDIDIQAAAKTLKAKRGGDL